VIAQFNDMTGIERLFAKYREKLPPLSWSPS